MLSLRLVRVRLLEMTVHALGRAGKREMSPQKEAELAAFFYLRKLGCMVVARNWKSGRSPGDIDLIAWEGETLCFVDVGIRTRRPASEETAPAQTAVQTGCCGALRRTSLTKPRCPECRPAWT